MKAYDLYGRQILTEAGYEHVQNIPQRIWDVRHKLGYQPAAVAIYISGQLAFAQVDHVDNDTTRITFNSNASGRVKVK